MASDTSGDELDKKICGLSKKRKITGRMSDVSKKIRLQSHEVGPDCHCKRFQCFEKVLPNERAKINKHFNESQEPTWDEQSAYLCGLILLSPVFQRRNRRPEEESHFRQASYFYKVRVLRNEGTVDIPVCLKAFCSLHGITRRRVQTIHTSLLVKGVAPKDNRGKQSYKHRALKEDIKNCVISYIRSFKGRSSHYSNKKSKKIYLPEDLNIRKMHSMYKLKHPDKSVSYETYRTIFSTDFNISFGYPRSDTCSKCDEFNARLKSLNLRLTQNITLEIKEFLNRKIRKLTLEKELHKKKTEAFYARKRQARLQSRKSIEIEAVAMDYQKNLPVPNITTNDVYYKRQLSFYSFNIHRLSYADSVFYTYSEEVAKKGSNEVCSVLEDYVTHHLPSSVKILIIFCDSCGGQHKNFTVFRYLRYLVHQKKRFQTIKVVFPIRGHSSS
ncbi:uncharacterized protein LOC126741556 [Anthonomus grandis grandis]|uniref:uncharacterized protein LOC126741556 n=1 Tax=Anthonomus grandis grandis TaxID=2921223 RepID=UPI002165D82B|nr:uncharacterized protein LOC126741556 [Anthonomus grandis grandis]